MKLSNREKVLILILIIAVAGYFGFKYEPLGGLFNLKALHEEHSQKRMAYDSMSQNIVLKKSFEEKAELLTDEINSLNVISDLQQENVIIFLNNYFKDNNIDASTISFTDAVVVQRSNAVAQAETKDISSLEELMDEINDTAQTIIKEATENRAEVQPGEVSVRAMTVNFTFNCTYDNLLKLIDAIQNNKVDMSIININAISTDGDTVQGTIAMNFYAVPKLKDYIEENEEWIWKDVALFGKYNPFSSASGSGLLSAASGKSDFYMSVKPDSSDLPTVIVGMSGDAGSSANIYADSNAMENIEFQFKEENDIYYFKYRAGVSTYPSDGSWKEFTPVVNDSAIVKVYSTPRNSTTDSAGVNINVINSSGLKIRFDIENDDAVNPRIYFKDPKNVIVTRN